MVLILNTAALNPICGVFGEKLPDTSIWLNNDTRQIIRGPRKSDPFSIGPGIILEKHPSTGADLGMRI